MRKFSEAEIYNLPEPEVATATRAINVGGEEYEFVIETGGQNSGERWHELYAAVMYGQTQKQIAEMTNATYTEEFMTPQGKRIVIRDASYIGSLKLLEQVLVEPKLTFQALAVLGHKIGGKAIDDLAMWASRENGVSEYMVEQMRKLSKNRRGVSGSSGKSGTPV